MKCPICDETLHLADRNGIEIDFCPKCRGIWLDRGELDKIIERSNSPIYQQYNPYSNGNADKSSESPRHSDSRLDEHRDADHQKKRGFLGELFDF